MDTTLPYFVGDAHLNLVNLRYVWVHVALAFAVRCEVTYNATVFLLLVLPVAMATASGHVMQLSADSIPMACLMQLLCSIEAMLE